MAVDWLNWPLRGDAKAAACFVDNRCGLCKGATLTVLAMLSAVPMVGVAAQPAEGNFSGDCAGFYLPAFVSASPRITLCMYGLVTLTSSTLAVEPLGV